MIKGRTIVAAFCLFATAFISQNAHAETWDFVYGEDPTNANNTSVFVDVAVDPIGGIFIFGYFYGAYEGFNSGADYRRFIQHRSPNGVVDWTILVPHERAQPASVPPSSPADLVVDGNGTAYISLSDIDVRGWLSVTRQGVLTVDQNRFRTSPLSQVNQFCWYKGVALQSGGLVRRCNSTYVEHVDASFTTTWTTDVSAYSDFTGMNEQYHTRLIPGPSSTVWLIGSLNPGNISQVQTQLPLGFRSALSMVQLDGRTGSKINSIKHYGRILGSREFGTAFEPIAEAIGERALWLATTSAPFTTGTAPKIESFSAVNGELIGELDTRWRSSEFSNPSQAYVPSDGLCQSFVERHKMSLVEKNSICVQSHPSEPIGWGNLSLYVPQNGGMINQWPECSTNSSLLNSCVEQIEVLNDGRRMIIAVGKTLMVLELTPDQLPMISSVLASEHFQSTIRAFDTDSLGNVYVVGSTVESRIIGQAEIRTAENRRIASLSIDRAFVAKNPTGRIGLDLLPRTPLRFKVTGANGVPASGVGAVSMNVTVTSPDAEGFITVYPCDSRPDASNLNYVLNQTVPNAVIAPVSANGEVCFYTFAQTHLIADVNGYFPSGSGFVSNTPARVFDTRVGSAQGLRTVSKTKVGDGTELRVQFTNLPGGITPATGVGAVSLNVTVTGSQAPAAGGFVTVYPCGNRPEASNLNFVSNQIVPNAVITPVSANGEVCFYVFGSTDLIADINGYFPSGAGFVATDPVRVADTRVGSAQGLRTVTKQRIGGNTTLQLQLTNLPGGITPASGIGAVSLNVTAVNTTANEYGGYVTTYPCGALPDVSSLNFVSNQIVPNAVIAPLSANGTICFYAYGQTDLIVDLNGYFPTGAGFVPVNPKRMFDTR